MNRTTSSIFLALALCFPAGWCLAQKPALDQGLVAYLPMRLDLTDHSAANNPVKTTGSVVLREGAAYFDGGTNALELPHLDFADHPFAVSIWIKITGKNPMYGLVQQRDETAWSRWLHIMLRGGRQPYLGFMMNDAISPEEIPDHKWEHLVFQYTGTRQELWINGRLLCARTSGAYQGTNGDTIIGESPKWSNVPCKDFEGYMRELRIYHRALSPAEITALYNPEKISQTSLTSANGDSTDTVPAPPLSDALAAEVGIPFLDIEGGKLVITGESRQIYEVQATSDMGAPWQPLVNLTNINGVVEFTDPDASKFSQRFYRVKTLQ